MDARLFARTGACAFVAVALTLSVIQLREQPPPPPTEIASVWKPDGDPLAAQLRTCGAMGELAQSAPDCGAAWAEQRRRFFGIGTKLDEPAADPGLPGPASKAPELRDR